MFSNTTLNRIYDRGSSVYNYSLGGDDFTARICRHSSYFRFNNSFYAIAKK